MHENWNARESYFALGMMSGTSLDGLDLALVHFGRKPRLHFEILKAQTLPYDSAWRQKLQHRPLTAQELLELDHQYGQFLGYSAAQFLARAQKECLPPPDFIASHGHTWFHQPQRRLSFQLGGGPQIAQYCALPSITDFRRQDLVMGGQGAPLVPIGDRDLFSDYAACLNLGGFANISFPQKKTLLAYDIAPLNIVLNRYAQALNQPYDDEGKIAASGTTNAALLQKLQRLPYYAQKPPKSLGVEWVESSLLPLLEQSGLAAENIIATFTEHAAQQLSAVLRSCPPGKILISGGGAYNRYLLERCAHLAERPLPAAPKILLEYKEALLFAYLGMLRLCGQNNVLGSVTGAPKDHCSGVVYHP